MKALFRKSFLFILCTYALLIGGLVYWQAIADLEGHPLNPTGYAVFRQPRGAIVDRDGKPLAESVSTDVGYRRVYASPSVSHITGYFHQRYGMTGLEKAYNSSLSQGQTVRTTIALPLQKHMEELMAGKVGAAVAMDPKTGAVLALVSYPYVDGNRLDESWSDYLQDERSPFVNRAVQGQYPPGSAIKPLVLGAAFAERAAYPEQPWVDRGAVELEGRAIKNFQGQALGRITTLEALAHSSNVVFALLAAELGPKLLTALSQFGLGEIPPLPLPMSRGRLPSPEQSDYGWGQIGIGHGDLLVTPLQMASAVSAIANGGKLMRPLLVQEVRGGWRLPRVQLPAAYTQVIPEWAAAAVRDGMVLAVERGTAREAALPGIPTAGKTGTAQTWAGQDHSWFVGFAPAYDPEVAVVVVLEHGGIASQTAAPLGGAVLQAALAACTPQGM